MKIRRMGGQGVSRKGLDVNIDKFTGLDTTTPYTQMEKTDSPYLDNVRLYARNTDDRRISVGTRKGQGYIMDPVGETIDQSITAVTGAADQAITNTAWAAETFTAGSDGRLTKVELNVKTSDNPTQHLIVCIYTDSSGSPGSCVATSSILTTSATSSYGYVAARFVEAPQVSSGTDYWVVAYQQEGGANNWNWSSTTDTTTALSSTNSGGSWSSISASLNLKTYISTDSIMKGGAQYTPVSGLNEVLFATGTDMYTLDVSDGTKSSIKSGLSANATAYYFDQADDEIYWVNGQDNCMKYDGTTVTSITGTYIPTAPKYIIFHKNRLFLVDGTDTTKLTFSELGDYDDFQSTNFIYCPSPKSGDPITGLAVFQDNLVVFTRNTKYVLFGEDPGNFVLRQSSGKKGAVSQSVIASDPNFIYYLADDGVWRYNGSSDQLVSDAIQNEIDGIATKTKASAVIHDNYYRLYYTTPTSGVNDGTVLFDTINKLWLRDTGVYVDRPFVLEDDTLLEGSSVVGTVYSAEQDYNDLGKPIDFKYHTNYLGSGLNKIFLRRVLPAVRLQTSPYSIDVLIDIDQRNTTPIQYTINAQPTGYEWGSTETWGGGATWGSATVSTPKPLAGTEAFWHQVRFEKNGVNTPVEILSILLQMRTRRVE